jgi:cytochrome c oxidase cbb3-type subunit 3
MRRTKSGELVWSGESRWLVSRNMRRAVIFALFLGVAGIFLSVSFVLVWAAAFVSHAQQPQPPKSTSPAKSSTGKRIFLSSCASCHGLDGRGGQHAPNIATNRGTQRRTDAELFRVIHDGSPSTDMPSFGSSLDSSEISAVVAYLRSLQGGQQAEKLPGDPRAGNQLFHGKAGCAECHMVAGSGGFIASDLTDYARSHPIVAIREAIVDPLKNPNPRGRAALVVTHDGTEFKGLVRNEDNFSVQLQSLDGSFQFFQNFDLKRFTFQSEPLMPADYGSRLSPHELNDLISFLMRSARGNQASALPSEHDERAGTE